MVLSLFKVNGLIIRDEYLYTMEALRESLLHLPLQLIWLLQELITASLVIHLP